MNTAAASFAQSRRGGSAPVEDPWLLTYDSYDPAHEGTREALCTLGNGYWASRGSVPGSVSDEVHYPGTYLAGVYNRVLTDREGRRAETEHLVNAPDWAYLTIAPDAGAAFEPDSAELVGFRQELDLRSGVLTRRQRFRDAAGRATLVTSRQFHSQVQPHLAALQVEVTAQNWSGMVRVRSAVNARVRNGNVVADRGLTDQHLTVLNATEPAADTVLLDVETTQSEVRLATAVRTRFPRSQGHATERITEPGLIGRVSAHQLTSNVPLLIEKVAVQVTSRDPALSTAALGAVDRLTGAGSFEELLTEHVAAWAQLWVRFGITLRADAQTSLALNLNIFHVLQSVAPAELELDAGVPARGLHGEGYRGHVFWDELFVYPMLTLRRPQLTRALLLYRYRRLAAARRAATAVGVPGAIFPWQSGSDGREETPTELFNPLSGGWMPDNSSRQRHVGLAVAYSVWQYYQATGDLEFLIDYGTEILIEVARAFTAMAAYDPATDRFDIVGVMGPDEFHDGYPDAPGEGLRNNAYTNVLASWVLARAAEALSLVPEHDRERLLGTLRLGSDEPIAWERMSRRVRVPFHDDGVISQFEGYADLAEFDWAAYRARYGNIGRLDLILQAEGKNTNSYRLSKQADVLMLFYLFSAEELTDIFARMGYVLHPEAIPRTIQFYGARSSHGSTLSRLVQSWVSVRADRGQSWALLLGALDSDLTDSQGGTTREGIHLGAMAGTVDLAIRCYGGLETRQDVLWLHPVLPPQLPSMSFELRYRGQPISVTITAAEVRLHLRRCVAAPIEVCVEGQRSTVGPGQTLTVALR